MQMMPAANTERGDSMTKIISGDTWRISVLTDRLLRLEYQEQGLFEDRPTQAVVNRDFPEVSCDVREENGRIFIDTGELSLSYDGKPFSTPGLSIRVKAAGTIWYYTVPFGNFDKNLYGTARTLDNTNGVVNLEDGIFGEEGYAVLNDSRSPVFDQDNYRTRETEEMDLYFFGYSRDYYGGLKDFYALCGKVPMLPRYALGNWWSRFYRYTEDTYLELLDQFDQEKIPLSVAVVDMDWHITEPDKKYGTGWTGWTWDPECFPDPERFLKKVHGRGLSVSLNLHPADGVRAFEDMYPQMAKRLGIDPSLEEQIEHDLENEEYRKAYFEEIMHPFEDMGVDFWWIDWQQGTGKTRKSVDPLLLLNHWHFTDQEERGKRAMIFSRYAGAGSHRYPLGFSGDTWATWESLSLQPYFTSTAANIGYGVWSHDIGGHMHGDRNDERFVRWVQFGVFSPIMRIHSCGSDFIHREPWTFAEPYRHILGDFLRLRHALVPYLYTAVKEASFSGRPLVCPMYYSCPDAEEAYEVKNAYTFGPSLIVGAVTEPADPCLRRAGVSIYLPEGRWTDIFTGQIYRGGTERRFYRTLESIPVLLREGGIVPMASYDCTNAAENPGKLRVLFGAGKDGAYTLYEDDGMTPAFEDGAYVNTVISQKWTGSGEKRECVLTIDPSEGDLSLIPAVRIYELVIAGAAVSPGETLTISAVIGDEEKELSWHREEKNGFICIVLGEVPSERGCRVYIRGLVPAENAAAKETLSLIDEAYIENDMKETLAEDLEEAGTAETFLKILERRNVPVILKDAIRENYT